MPHFKKYKPLPKNSRPTYNQPKNMTKEKYRILEMQMPKQCEKKNLMHNQHQRQQLFGQHGPLECPVEEKCSIISFIEIAENN
jgi:hypothetical protein